MSGKITMAELRAYYPALALVAEEGMRNPIDPDEAAWLDGPSFVRWLRQNGLDKTTQLGESTGRAINRWAAGDAVNLASADQVLTDLGHNLNDLPANVWRNRPRRTRGKRRRSPYAKEVVLREYDEGVTPERLRERYGVPAKTLNLWIADRDRKAA